MSKASLELGGGNWAAKDGKLLGYAVGDTSGKYLPREFTFSRTADIAATRVNKDGLIEKLRENQFTYSNDFRISSGWGHAGLSAYYGPENNPQLVPDGEQGYDGSGGASFLLSTTGTSVHQINTTAPDIAAVQTFSIYAKALGYKWLVIRAAHSTMESYFDLENGEVGTVESNVIEAKMVNAGNGWYRCSMTVNNSVTVTSVAFGMSDGDNNHNFAGNKDEGGTDRGGIYVMHAQWDRGLVAAEYIGSGATTGKAGVLDNLPRIDYTSGSAQLLMEPSRTNELPHSEYFTSQAYWQLNSAGTRTDNVAVSPEGVKNAMSLKSVGSEYNILRSAPVSLDTSTEYVFSFYAKNVDATNAHYRVYNTDAPGDVVGSTSYISQLSTTEWKRIEVSFTTNATDTNYSVYFASGNLGGEILLWGAQLEKGGYATSYIPTYGASDTRAFDYFADESYNDVLGNGDLSVFVDFDYAATGREGSTTALYVYSGSNNFGIKGTNPTNKQLQVYAGGGFTTNITFNTSEQATRIKALIRTNGTTVELFFNGAKDTETMTFGGSLPYAWDDIRFTGSNSFLAKYNRIAIFTESLSDAECIALTTV